MTEYYIAYNIETGEADARFQGPEGSAAIQKVGEGFATMVVPYAAFVSTPLDIAPIKSSYATSIDADADKVAFACGFNNTPRQVATYLEKEAEARRVLAGDDAATVFLTAEAAVIGMSVAELAQEVVDQADLWRPIGAKIEALRRSAKIKVAAATNLGQLAAAARIDWHAVIAPAG